MIAASGISALVIGAGIIGRSVAYFLSWRGVSVDLLEAGSGPSLTTRASLGVLTHFNGRDNPYSALFRDGHASYGPLAAQLKAETGVDIGWRAAGGIDLIFSDEDEEGAEELLRFNQERGCPVERLGADAVLKREPGLSRRVRGGIFFPGDHRVDPERLAEGLLRGAEQRGARVHWEEGLEGVEECGPDRIRVRTGRGERAADFLVLAAGAWSGRLGELFGARIPVRPIRGQHARFGGDVQVRHVLRHGGRHLISSGEQIIVGATVEEVGFAPQTTPAAAAEFRQVWERVLAFEPQMAGQFAGLRPKPKGGRPLIGPLRQAPRVLVATGHYKNGILLGALTGQLIAGWVVDGDPGRDMSYFAPER